MGNETENKPIATPPAAPPEQNPAQNISPQGDVSSSASKGFDKDALIAEFGKVVDEKVTTAIRRMQSQADKMEARVKQEVERAVALSKQSGLAEPTPEQRAKMADVVRQQIMEEQTAQPPASNPTQQSGQTQEQGAKIDLDVFVKELEKDVPENFRLYEADPEAQELKGLSPVQWLKKYEELLTKKKERLTAESKQKAQAQTPLSSGQGTPGNPLSGITDPMTLYQMGLKKH